MKHSPLHWPSTVERLEARIAPATFVVTTLADAGHGSLRQAILDANTAEGTDQIVFQHASHASAPTPLRGIIYLKSDLPTITDEVTIHDLYITAPGHQNIEIDGQHHAIFAVASLSATQTVTIADLALEGGQAVAGGAIQIAAGDGSVTLSNLLVAKNRAVGAPSQFSNNWARGGGIDVESGTVLLDHAKVIGNTAVGERGLLDDEPGEFASGGGINVAVGGHLEVRNSLIAQNVAVGGNGMRGSNGGRSLDSGFYWYADYGGSGGRASGGGIFSEGELTVTHSTLSSNVAKGGNGSAGGNGEKASPYTPPDEPYIGAFGGWGGDAAGGGIGSNGGDVTITGSSLLSNRAVGGHGAPGGAGGTPYSYYPENGGAGGFGGKANGGGVQMLYGTLTIDSSTIAENHAIAGVGDPGGARGASGHAGASGAAAVASVGGGIASSTAVLAVSQTTIAENSATHGGGVASNADTSVRIANSTIALNAGTGSAGEGGGILTDESSALVDVISTIVAENTARDFAEVYGAFTSDHNLIQKYPVDVISDPATMVGVNPLLGPLRLNGGSTMTMLPVAGSPVIDKGSNPDHLTVDQRGIARVRNDAINIGAVE